MIKYFFSALFIFSFVVSGYSQETKYKPDWRSLDSRPIPGWFQEAKFGIFIHWGVYSVPAWRKVVPGRYASYAEWYYARVMFDTVQGGADFHNKNYGKDFEYRDFGPLFKAELWNPDYWAELFKRSGAKYVVLTSKHHDGYCLWPTNSPYKKDWNSNDVGPKRDLVGELTTAVRNKGLKMGLYYSIIEWETNKTHRTNTGYFIPEYLVEKYSIPKEDYIDKHMIPQLKELVEKYEPSLIFSDAGEWDKSSEEWKTIDFLSWLYNEAPNKEEVVVNDRFGKDMPGKHGDYFSSEYEDAEGMGSSHPWEESRGMGVSYGYNRAEDIEIYNSSKQLIHELIEIVSRGGNLLLNVGPTADGRIPVIMQERLLDIGEWLDLNGEAIYGTHPRGPSSENQQQNIYFTQKDGNIFVLCTEWPGNNLEITGISDSVEDINLIGYEKNIDWKVMNGKVSITPPLVSPGTFKGKYAYVFQIKLNVK